MTLSDISAKIHQHLHALCVEIPHRHVGSSGNRRATDYAADVFRTHGYAVECSEFDCIDWETGTASLHAGDASFDVRVSPYSLPFEGRAPLVALSTLDQLRHTDLADKIVLLHGELTREQLMPKNFVYYNPEQHQQIIGLLESKKPRAIIAATARNPELAGALNPFPLFEDGDFDIPSVYMTDVEGTCLMPYVGQPVDLTITSKRIPSTGCNVTVRRGKKMASRIMLCAHVDTKIDTPGALDNGSGVATLLALAELLARETATPDFEIVLFNGEDYYAASGQMHYLAMNQDNLDALALVINMDLAGYRDARTIYSLFSLPPQMKHTAHHVFGKLYDCDKGERWYQSDHGIFVQYGRPAIALTSANFMALSTEITHTPQDRIELVNCDELAKTALALRQFLLDVQID